jgi:hypothetical protein
VSPEGARVREAIVAERPWRAERRRGRCPRRARATSLVNGEIALSGPAVDIFRNPDVLTSHLGR